MADTTVTIKQDGTGDYTTIGSAVAAANVSSGYWKMEIQDSNTYNESINIATASTTSSNYVWLTVASSHRHQGVYATSGHARLISSSYPLKLNSDYARVEYLEILGTGTTALSVQNPCDNGLVSRCVMSTSSNSNVAYIYPIGTFSMDNCVLHGGTFNTVQVWANYDVDLNIDFCSIMGGADYALRAEPPGTNTLACRSDIYNTALAPTDTTSITTGGWSASGNGSWTHNGSHNAWDNDTSNFGSASGSYTNSQDIPYGNVTTTTTTANAMIVTSTSGYGNYTPVEATGPGSNLVLGNGTNRQGSEPDSRQDFSTDIRGAARPTAAGKIDIGAFQITTVAGFKYYNGSNFVDTTAVQYYNGSTWVDVTGIQYYNGSAWTDPS